MRLDLKTAVPVAGRLPEPGARVTAAIRLAFERVGVCYGTVTALEDVSLDVAAGEIVCLLGPSGSGKSTLLRVAAGIERPSAGRIVLDGVEVAGPGRFVDAEHRCVGMVFQDYALFPHLTVAANVAFGLRGRPRSEVERIVGGLLERVGLSRHARAYPHTLSGGERQRAALARALAPSPRVLLMDEPFSSLDGRLRDTVREETLDLLRETGTTTLLVTHDPGEAMRVADRIALLDQGRLVQCGSSAEIYARPATVQAARVFSDVNEIGGTCRDGRVQTPLGVFEAPGLADGALASVCIRPEHLRLSRTPTGLAAHVVRAACLGEVDHLVLRVPGLDTRLVVRAFGRTGLAAGDTAYVELPALAAAVVPRGEG